MGDLSRTDLLLPHVLVLQICSHGSKQDQLRSRSVSRKLHYEATIHAFHSLRPLPEGNSAAHFINIALSKTLRTYIQEVTIDTERNPLYGYPEGEYIMLFENLANALTYLVFFRNLSRLYLLSIGL